MAADGAVEATAASPFGVAYALETLSQLIGPDGRLVCSGLVVRDRPAYVHRGLMIDTGRRFYPVSASICLPTWR